jgi:hypothetical protein
MAGRRDAIVVAGAAASAARVLRKDFSAKIISRVGSAALRRGMHSGSKGWLYVAAAASGARLLRKYAGRQEEVLSIRLKPGQSIRIREIARSK